MAVPIAYGCSQTRDWIQVTAVTYTVAAATLDPLTTCTGDRTHASAVTWALSIRFFFFFFFFFFFLLLKAAPTIHGGSQARGRIELQLLAYTPATATKDLSRIYDLHHNSQKCWILNPLSEAGMEPANSWFLVGFISAEPWWELPFQSNS